VRLGWASGDEEVFSMQQMIELFDIQKVGASAAVFNPEKLLWLNGHWIRHYPPEKLVAAAQPFLKNRGVEVDDSKFAEHALASCQEKVKTLVELADMAAFYFQKEIFINEEARKKGLDEEGRATLEKLVPFFETQVSDWKHDAIEANLKTFAETQGLKLGKIAQPLRAALTGSMVSPGIFDVIAILGKDRTLERIKVALAS